MKDKMILNTSDEAAKFTEGISGWVSRNGRFYGDDERTARWDGCTHVECGDCKEPVERGRIYCSPCLEKRMVAKHKAIPKGEWDGVKGMVYSDYADEYFSSWDGICDYLEENEIDDIDTLRLVICEPVPLSPIAPDYWADDLPEDYVFPDNVLEAIDKLNEALATIEPAMWMPGKKRL